MVDAEVMTAARGYLRALADEGIPVRFGVLFGSQVTGRADEWSDIDLVVVSPQFDEQYTLDDVSRLWHMTARTDSRIEPIPCGERQWREDDVSTILEVARREGQQVDL